MMSDLPTPTRPQHLAMLGMLNAAKARLSRAAGPLDAVLDTEGSGPDVQGLAAMIRDLIAMRRDAPLPAAEAALGILTDLDAVPWPLEWLQQQPRAAVEAMSRQTMLRRVAEQTAEQTALLHLTHFDEAAWFQAALVVRWVKLYIGNLEAHGLGVEAMRAAEPARG